MQPVTWKERLQYKFDNYMSRGTGALIGGLAVLSLVIIAIAALIIVLVGISPGDSGDKLSFFEAFWEAMMRTLDAGTMGSDTGWSYRWVMFGVTVGGVLVISSLIGVLTSGVEGKMESLRKGRSRVVEAGHTVILGWSAQVFSIIAELVIANQNQSNPCIVILGDKDKVEMEDEIHERIPDPGRTRIVCRTGSSIDMADLDLVSLQTTRSIIILSSDNQHPDAEVIKTMLAIINSPDRRPEPYHIVAEIRDPKNLEVAQLVGKDEVELVSVGNLVSRIIAQTCRQSGLSVVYTELLDFGGDEIYFKTEPELVGQTFGEALLAYEDSALLGLYTGSGQVQLNPPMDTLIQPGDQVIAISEDDDTIHLSRLKDLKIDNRAIYTAELRPPAPERTLILGWNWRGVAILHELDNYVAPGSQVTVLADLQEVENTLKECCDGLRNQTLQFILGNSTDRKVLENQVSNSLNHIIVLSYSDDLEDQQADSATMITLLHLRSIVEHQNHTYSITSEMQDIRNRELAEVTQVDDFIVSDKLISLMLAQISENKRLNAVFADIFDPEGSEIYLKPARNYVNLGQPINFYTIVEAARRRCEVAIGFRLAYQEKQAGNNYGVVLNPDKSKAVTFSGNDHIIVVSEN